MRRHLLGAAVGLAAVAAALGCTHKGNFKELGVDEVAQLQSAAAVTFVDANTADFRKENGVIPGAILLDSSSKYELSVLPQDKAGALVFYCSNRL